jgi:hypothetical protein
VRPPSRRFAVTAIVLAALGLLAGCTDTPAPLPTSSATRATDGAHASAMDITVGDCLDDATAGSTTATATIVPCSGPHDSEAYADITLTGSAYPGLDAVQAQAQTGCQGDAFADFIGIASDDSTLQVSYYYPTEDSWAGGDRTVTCTVFAVDASGKAARTTGTLKDSAK